MTSLYVAAGGGGDALAAAILHRALADAHPAVIATYAWDRLAVDPHPGPRSPADFIGLEPIGRDNYAVVPTTRLRPPGSSTLPRLAGDLTDTLALLDPSGGAARMRTQLAELAEINVASAVTVVDVGGDALAEGDEPGLRSPLADALTLAACTGLDVPVAVLVAGPGLDGELNEAQVLEVTGTTPRQRLAAEDVTPFRSTLDWHPSEATALLVAAARGIRGRVEIRDSGLVVELTDTSPAVFELSLRDALDSNAVAVALANTTTLVEAEDVTRRRCGFSEIDYERAKQQRAKSAPPSTDDLDLDPAIDAFERAAAARGVDFVTFRRVAEAIGTSRIDPTALRRHLVAARPHRFHWPMWRVSGSAGRATATSRPATTSGRATAATDRLGLP